MEEYLGSARDVPSNSQQLSYFVSFTVPQQKIRIRIPKLVAKTMQRKLSGYNRVVELEEVQDIRVADESKHEKKERAKNRTRNLLPKRFYSIVCKVFGAGFLSEGKTDEGQRYCNQLRHQGEGEEPKRRVFYLNFSNELKNGLAYKNDQPFELIGYGGKQRRHDDKIVQNMDPLKWLDKHLLEMHQSLLGFFEKKNRCNFIKRKMNSENKNPNLCTAENSEKGIDAINNITSLGTSFTLVGGKQKNRLRLHNVRSRILITGRKLKMPRSLQRRFNKHYSDVEDGDDVYDRDKMRYGNVELCRKRILMGGKCRPLNSSGTLAYDENGCLIPEAIP